MILLALLLSSPIAAQETGSITGRLLLADGVTPAADHIVAIQSGLIPDEGADPAAYASGATGSYAQSAVADDGSFTLSDLAADVYALDIRRAGEREAWCSVAGVEVKPDEATELGDVTVAEHGWRYMFDRTSLDGWMASNFHGQREVKVEDQAVVLSMGEDMTGIHWPGEVPRLDYEVTFQARRVEGDDFFCGFTFPVADSHISLILGGWGGSTVGLSSLEDADASMNETSQWITFKEQRWYRVRVRVTPGNITVWLDEEEIIDLDTTDRRIDTRIEMNHSKPFGIATWRTTGAARDIRIRGVE
ncbi:MAG TPA: DUF1080 domain-containing protein [Armatimonadota bacterium]|nr:DUF1080 domain-containing protein [Armatimonadota bacterium]